MSEPNRIVINDVEYAPVSEVPKGNRAIVVVDRGWIFAGNVTRENGRIRISDALHVFKWVAVGFDGMIDNPVKAKADLRKIPDVDLPEGSEVFCVPVPDSWGK